MKEKKCKRMVMNKWKVLRIGLAFSCLLVAFTCMKFLLKARHVVVMWGTKNKAGSKSNHQLSCLLTAPTNIRKELLFSRQIFSHRCKRVFLLQFLPQPYSISKMSRMISGVLFWELKIRGSGYHEAGGTVLGLELTVFVCTSHPTEIQETCGFLI